jgi:uncharacterized membrane protein YphA (DoxX/SURF4 family)
MCHSVEMKIPRWLWSPAITPRAASISLVFIRIAFGYHLYQYAAPMVLHASERAEFVQMLAGRGVPVPAIAGVIAIGAEFLGALSLMLGFLVRPACGVLLLNFAVALLVVHRNHAYMQAFEAIQMFLVCLTLLGAGAGAWSIDALIARRRRGDIDY